MKPKQAMKSNAIHLKVGFILVAAWMAGRVLAADSGSISAGLFTRNYAGLVKGRTYRLTTSEEKGGDPMMDVGDIRAHLAVVDVGPGVYSPGDGYPDQTYGGDEQGYGVPTFHIATAGVSPELLKAGSRPPRPWLRDIQTGYLMNYAFRAMRPYLWQQTPRLSG